MNHQQWIDAHYPDQQSAYGKCAEATLEMQKEFPDLRRVRGFAHCPAPWGTREHWWLVTPNGEVVDPTVRQFPAVFSYQELTEDEIPTGKCPNCGEFCFKGQDFCSRHCASSYHAYITGGTL